MSNQWYIFQRKDGSFTTVRENSKEYSKLMLKAYCCHPGFRTRELARIDIKRRQALEEHFQGDIEYIPNQSSKPNLFQRIINWFKKA